MRASTFFTLLTYVGCWRPVSWRSSMQKAIYNVYSLFLILMFLTFIISQIGSIFTVEKFEEFVESMCILITVVIGSIKLINVLLFRRSIINLSNFFLMEPCAILNTEEATIQTMYDNKIRKYALRYTALVEFTVSITIFSSLLTNFRHNKLTYRAWIPYNYTSTIGLSFAFVHQAICLWMNSLVHVAMDILFFGMLIQIGCQYDILLLRLNKIKEHSKRILENYVHHHNCIYQLAAMLNETLYLTIVAQFFGNFLALGLSMIQLLKADILSSDFFTSIFFLVSIMIQNFLYCWYGNELKLKSINLADAIFQIDWTELSKEARQILLITMCRTRSPIEFECAHVITVNIDFFVILVKSSYSAYNILQNSQK